MSRASAVPAAPPALAWDRADGPEAATATVAWAVALAQVLPRLKDRGREAGTAVNSAVGAAFSDGEGPVSPEVARMLADGERLTRLLESGAPESAERHAAKLVREALELLPAGRELPDDLAGRAVAAAAAVARVRCIAEALADDAADEDATTERRVAPPLDLTLVPRARSAAVARAGAAELDRCLPELVRAAARLAARLGTPGVAPARARALERAARAAARSRIGASRTRRLRRAAELAEQVRERLSDGTAPAFVPAPPGDPALLTWLRRLTQYELHTPQFETVQEAWLAGDPFGLRELPPPPSFLDGLDLGSLPAAHVAPLLRRISLTRAAPSADELTPEALAADAGRVSLANRTAEERRWGRARGSGAPLLAETTAIPNVVHGIWVGGPMPSTTVFRENYARAARRYAGKVDFVVWTDVPRAQFDAARNEWDAQDARDQRGERDQRERRHEGRLRPSGSAEVRDMLDWAVDNGIQLVSIHEVFHAGAPMRLHAPFVLEMTKQLPRGYASASDHLRVDIVSRLGGAYVDGDVVLCGDEHGTADPEEPLPDFLDRIAGSLHGFTMNPLAGQGVCNDIVVAPAGHPALALWIECARINYCRTQPELFGGVRTMAKPYVGQSDQALRYVAPSRTGRVHHTVLQLLGIPGDDLPPCDRARHYGSEGSWAHALPECPRAPRTVPAEAVPDVLARCLTFLRWQLLAREGDLYLAPVDAVIRRLPDPEAAWSALLALLPELLDGLPVAVASVTDGRRNDDGTLERTALPPEAELALDRTARPERWIGAPVSATGGPVTLLDEFVGPVALGAEPADRPEVGVVARATRAWRAWADWTEVALDPLGTVVGLWLRPPHGTDVWRYPGRFTGVADGRLRISLGLTPSVDWARELEIHPETLAQLVLAVGAAGRAVELAVPTGCAESRRAFAERLQRLLGAPVSVVEFGPGAVAAPPTVAPVVPEFRCVPLSAVAKGLRAT